MATKPSENGSKASFYRQLLLAQYDAYLKVAVRKHGLSSDMFLRRAEEMSNEELASTITALRDLAHLPPE
jgi:hypothetical protein